MLCGMNKNAFCIILLFFIIFESNIKSQDYLDTSKIVIKRVSEPKPLEYNITDTHIKKLSAGKKFTSEYFNYRKDFFIKK